MAYTTPATAVAGTVLTAAFLNTNVRDDVAWLASDSPACRAYNNANISIPDTTETALTFNSERFDNASMHSTSSQTSRIVIPTGGGGKYVTGGGVVWTASTAGSYRAVYQRINATTRISSSFGPPNAAVGSDVTPCTIFAFTAADYVELTAQQNSGGALNVLTFTSYSPEFWALWFRI